VCTFAIDTSGRSSYMALADDRGLYSVCSTADDSHAETLATLFSDLLEKSGCKVSDITKILFGAGPGSFTGLRIGLAFAKGIACANLVPVYQVSSLTALARANASNGEVVIATSDARRDECFFQIHLMREGDFVALNEPSIVENSMLQGVVKDLLQQQGLANIGTTTVCAESQLQINLAEQLIKLSLKHGVVERLSASAGGSLEEEQFFINLAAIEPNYVRAVAARKISERG
jgi:tRNA threonylcarbamoyl adenosine modification protein YeaZ